MLEIRTVISLGHIVISIQLAGTNLTHKARMEKKKKKTLAGS